MSRVKLKPCPFCGGRAKLYTWPWIHVGCTGRQHCLIYELVTKPPGYTEAHAVAAWNRRPGPSRGRRTRGK